MADSNVLRLAAEASLADAKQALERARGGDAEFEADVQSGGMLPVQLRVSVDAATPDGREFTVECHNDDVWVERPSHLPALAEDVRQVASKDFGTLSSQLRDRGVDVSANELAEMYVEVTLDVSLSDVVSDPRARAAF